MKSQDSRPLVAHLIYHLGTGGLERVMLNCIQALPAEKYRHCVISLTGQDEFAKQLPSDVQIVTLGKKPGADLKIHWHLFKLLRRLKPAVLHSYNIATLEYQAAAWAAGVKARIHAEHGRDIFDPQGLNKKLRVLRRLLAPFVHQFVAVSQDLASWLVNDVGLSPSKVRLVYNGVNTERFQPRPQPHSIFEFIHVARLAAIKDQRTLLYAAKQLAERATTPWQLSIVGDGPLAAELHALASELNLSQVRFLGERTDIASLMQAADCFVLSSLAEGIPMTLLEAMASGLPFISTAVGGVPEIAAPGYATLVPAAAASELANAMQQWLENADEITAAKHAARQSAVDSFSEKRMIEQYDQLYQQFQ